MTGSFEGWSESWEKPKQYQGLRIPQDQVPKRIREILSLWTGPLPSNWIRPDWSYIKVKGYRRGDLARPKGEHLLEVRLFEVTSWPVKGLGEEVTFAPILNAVSLANQNQKQREVDVLGILTFPQNRILCSVEMKGASTNSAWFAVVENLQHLKLIQNHPQDFLPLASPFENLRNLAWSETWGMVLAPPSFFDSRPQRKNSFIDAKELIRIIKQEVGVTILLAHFQPEAEKSIEVLFRPD